MTSNYEQMPPLPDEEGTFSEYSKIEKDHTDIEFSYFLPPITNTKPLCTINLRKVYDLVRSDFYKIHTEKVRENNALKKIILPYVCPSGTFESHTDLGLIDYTGILCADIDDCPLEMKDTLAGDPFLNFSLIYTSPRGKGLKGFISINNANAKEHLLYFNSVYQYLFETYGLKMDKSCKNVSRAVFLCMDEKAYFSHGSIERDELLSILPPLPPVPAPVVTIPTSPVYSSSINEDSQKPSQLLNRLPEVHARAVADLQLSGWQQINEFHWVRPGKDPKEGHSSIYNIDPQDSLWKMTVFSENAYPFLVKGYTDVQIICLLEFNDQFDVCIKSLMNEYFPQKPDPKYSFSSTLPNKDIQMNTPDTYFQIRPVASVIADGKKEKPRRKLIGAFIYEDTNSYFYAPPNYGKSMAVFQMAYAAATGTSMDKCSAMLNECEPKIVLSVDLENDAQTIYERHEAVLNCNEPELLKNLIFLHEPVGEKPLFNYDLLQKILDIALETKAQLIIIDNISKLLPDLLKAEDVTRFIEFVNRVRLLTGASIVIVGHTVKNNPRVAVLPNSYFGTSMLANFFKEMFYLDRTREGKYFLCHAKAKHKEEYTTTVPVFTLGDHPIVGTGFSFEGLMPLSEVQLPLALTPANASKRGNLSKYKREIAILDAAGVNRTTIAAMCDVSRSTIYRLFES